MMSKITKSLTLIKTLNPNSIKSITTFSLFNQQHQPQFSDQQPLPQPPPPPSSFPPNPSTGSPLYQQNWRSPFPTTANSSLIPLQQRNQFTPQPPSIDANSLLNLFTDWVTTSRWVDIKETFEHWLRSLDVHGKPNRPNVELFNHYLRAHLMCDHLGIDLIKIVEMMDSYLVVPNTASFNLVLKAIKPRDWKSTISIFQRMLQSGKQSQPDDESFDLVIGKLFRENQIEEALKYADLTLKSGYMLSSWVFDHCVESCISMQKLDVLESFLEKCKAMDQNKALFPNWNLSNALAVAAIQNGNSKLTFQALGFLARLIQRGENTWPTAQLSVFEGLVVKALGTSGRSYDSTLLDASWFILKRSLRDKKAPNPETYLAKINALASLGNLPSAFSTLGELEKNHGNSSSNADGDLFSPFTSLHQLVVACSEKGHESLDWVYFQLENLSRTDPPYKSVAALNCVILGCANIWDLDRAYQTFESIRSTFGLTPNIHSYNALMSAFGKLRKIEEAARVFDCLSSLGVKPNAMSYSLLVDAHLVNRDPIAAIAVAEAMIEAGFKPSRPTLLKIRRRCQREMDRETDDRVESIVRHGHFRNFSETRRNILFKMDFSAENGH